MTGAQAIVRTLKAYGINTIFALPGYQLDMMFDALYDEKDSIRIIHTRHEQGAAYMAFGYAQSTGNVGVCLVVPGPGLLNASAALSTAYACNAPVFALSGQIRSGMIGKGMGFLHEIPNQLGMIRSVTKWAVRANSPDEGPALVQEAFRQLTRGRPRPVELEMAMDIMGQKTEISIPKPDVEFEEWNCDDQLIDKAVSCLAAANNPVIIVGGGAMHAGADILELAEILQAPVTMTTSGKGAVDEHSYLALNRIAAEDFWRQADVILAVGSRLLGPSLYWGWGIKDHVKVVRIDIDETAISLPAKPDIGILGDSKKCIAELLKRTEQYKGKRISREDDFSAAKKKAADTIAEFHPQASYNTILRQVLPEDGILVNEMTQMGYFTDLCFPVYCPRTYIHSGYQGTLGFGFATAMGAKVANPDKPVLSINGDGGFLFTSQELATAVQHHINVVAVVFCNNAYGKVRQTQKRQYRGRTIASDLKNPDFVKYAQSYGAAGFRVESPKTLRKAIEDAFSYDGPTVIEVQLGKMSFFDMY